MTAEAKHRGLTAQQELFATEFARTNDGPAAYRKAYPTTQANERTISTECARLMKRPHVAARVAELRVGALRKHEISVERTIGEAARVGFSDIRRLFREDGSLIPLHELDEEAAAAIASVEVEQVYEGKGENRKLIGHIRKIRLWDKNTALTTLGKHLGAFEKDNQQQREELCLRLEIAK